MYKGMNVCCVCGHVCNHVYKRMCVLIGWCVHVSSRERSPEERQAHVRL